MKRNVVVDRHIRKGIFAFLIFSFVFQCYGQGYLVHHYSENEGLPSAEVYDITQDRLGRMWFATRTGISCYDGLSWRNYTVSDGLPALTFIKIATDRKGQVWALSDPLRYDRLYITVFNGTKWNRVTELEVTGFRKGDVISFQLLERDTGTEIVVGTASLGLYLWKGGEWKKITTKNDVLSNSINGITELNGTCYLATGKGLVELKSDGTCDNRLNEILNLSGRGIWGICVEHKEFCPDSALKDSRVWLYGTQWFGYFYEGGKNPVLFDIGIDFLNKTGGIKLLPDYRGGLYLGGLNEIYYFNYKTGESELIGTRNGLISGSAYSMFVDFEKNIWISSARGVSKIASRRFANFQGIHGLLEDEVSAVVEYEPGKFILGHNRGITVWDGKKFDPLPFAGKDGRPYPFCRILDMKVDSRHNTWAIAEGIGLCRIDKQRRIDWYGKEHGLNGYPSSLWIYNKDALYVGADHGIYIRRGNRFTAMAPGEFSGTRVRKIYMTPRGTLCLASIERGIYLYKNERWVNVQRAGESKSNNVYAIHEDHVGRLWIGTLGGLYVLDRETMKKFRKNDFEINRPVYFIVEDRKHHLWFGTDNGVVRYDGSRAVRYSISEGLVGQETNRAAGMVDSSGKVWIGTNRGVSIYNEQFDSHMSWNPPPKLRLRYIEADDRRIALGQTIELSHSTHGIVFYFNGISFVDEKALRFKHKLVGFDKGWSDEHYPYNQMIRYSNLSPGLYRFHLKVRNAGGVWSEPVTSPTLIILKPFYTRWWFYLLAFAAVSFLFYAVFRFLTQQRYAALLKKKVKERTGQMRLAEEKYRTLFEESKDVVFISTPEGKLEDINPAGVELFGFTSEKTILHNATTVDLYQNPEDRNAFRKAIEKKGYVKDYEITLKGKKGKKIAALITATLVRDEQGNINAYRGTIRDISDKKRLEQQLIQSQKMEAIGTLAGGIAHDFNNLLGVILGNTEMMLDDLQDGTDMHQMAEQVAIATKRAAEVVKQILTFSRQSQQERKPLRIGIVITEALKLLRSSLPATIEIRRNLDVDSDTIMANIVQIHRVLMNLCANAAFAMRGPGGILEVKLDNIHFDADTAARYNKLSPGDYLELTVSDTGEGISPKVIKRIFEPYFTTKKTGEGTGMGLAVVHGIIKNHGGDIRVTSKPGKGSTFQVFLPLIEGSVQQDKTTREDIPGGSEGILFVDDEIELVRGVKKMLERLGYEVMGESVPRAALILFREEPDRFDLLITDLTMPGMTGFKLAEEVRRIKPGIPIIFCSGFSAALSDEQIEAFGLCDFVMKPIIKRDLARVIRTLLDKEGES
ncbi:ATP-binding protein [Acidobacteriota bacterium]